MRHIVEFFFSKSSAWESEIDGLEGDPPHATERIRRIPSRMRIT